MFRFRQPCSQEFTQQRLQRGVGGDELIVGGGVVALGADGGEEIAECGLVFVGDEVGLGNDGGAVFEIDKAVRAVELESKLKRVHQMEDGNIVLAVAEVLEGIAKFGGIGKEIG